LDDGFSISVHKGVSDDVRGVVCGVTDFFESDFVLDFFGGSRDLATAFELAGDFGDGFVSNFSCLADPAHSQEINAESVKAALVHERAGHDAVVDEVAREEPIVGMDVGFAGDLANGKTAASRIEFENAMDEDHAA
jgi:hypothetical protein